MALSRTVSEINGDFSRKSQIFPTPVYFVSQMKGFSLKLGIGVRGEKTGVTELPGRERSLTISSAVWIQYTNVTDGQTGALKMQDQKMQDHLHVNAANR